jgi:hypothetical protein
MEIVIVVETREPPVGRLRAVSREPGEPDEPERWVEFTGWLGLLRSLDDVIRPPSPAP